jgi:hypothetical protein
LLAAVFALLAYRRLPRGVFWALSATCFAVVPAAVAVRDLDVGDTRALIASLALSGAAVALAVRRAPLAGAGSPLAPLRDLGTGAAVLTGVTLALAMVVTGTSFAGFVDGALTQALRVSGSFKVQAPAELLPAVLGLLAAVAVTRVRLSNDRDAAMASGVGRFLAGLYCLDLLLVTVPFGAPNFTLLAWGAPLAWVVTLKDPRGPEHDNRFSRVFLASLCVLEMMYAYPVAGTQSAFGAAPLAAVAAICLADGSRLIASAVGDRMPRGSAALAAALTAFVVYLAAVSPLWDEAPTYDKRVSLKFAGATDVHVDPDARSRLRWLDDQLSGCSTFVTEPGMSSLYLFTDKTPPAFLTQVWMRLLSDERQRAIVRSVRDDDRLCAVVNDELSRFWATEGPYPRGPLVRFIDDCFIVAAERGPDHVLRRRPNCRAPVDA